MIGELTEEHFIECKIKELEAEREHYRLLRNTYTKYQFDLPDNSSYENLYYQAFDNYNLACDKINMFKNLLKK